MERKEFLRTLGLGIIAVPLAAQCGYSEPDPDLCPATFPETAGPFPTKDPASLTMQDITSGREGLALAITILIKDKKAACAPRENLVVDIWHCDKDGNYSEYGGTGMQSANYTSVHFLRGRQTTSSNGQVGFNSIFPGWYPGRAPHIHVHIHSSTGQSLLVTQIAFPKDVTDAVYSTNSFYSSRGKQDTTNESDNVFRDGFSTEMAALGGTANTGYALTHEIVVDA